MAQNQELYDFSDFNLLEEKRQFIKDIIRKHVELANISATAHPIDRTLFIQLHLIKCIHDLNFYKLLAQHINGRISVRQFAKIFANLLDKKLDIVVVN